MWKSYENQLFSGTIVICCKCCSLATYFSYIFMCTNDKFIGMTYLSRWFLIKDVLQGCRTTHALKTLLMKYYFYLLERMNVMVIMRIIRIRFSIYHMIQNTAIQIVLQYVSDISRWFYIPFHWYWIDGCLWYSIWSMQK